MGSGRTFHQEGGPGPVGFGQRFGQYLAGHAEVGSLADVATTTKVAHQGFGAIDDWANSSDVTNWGFGSLDDVGAAQR